MFQFLVPESLSLAKEHKEVSKTIATYVVEGGSSLVGYQKKKIIFPLSCLNCWSLTASLFGIPVLKSDVNKKRSQKSRE